MPLHCSSLGTAHTPSVPSHASLLGREREPYPPSSGNPDPGNIAAIFRSRLKNISGFQRKKLRCWEAKCHVLSETVFLRSDSSECLPRGCWYSQLSRRAAPWHQSRLEPQERNLKLAPKWQILTDVGMRCAVLEDWENLEGLLCHAVTLSISLAGLVKARGVLQSWA